MDRVCQGQNSLETKKDGKLRGCGCKRRFDTTAHARRLGSRALVPESLAIRGGDLIHQLPDKLAPCGSECTKLVVDVQQKRGRVVWIEGCEGVTRGGGKTEGNQAKTESD